MVWVIPLLLIIATTGCLKKIDADQLTVTAELPFIQELPLQIDVKLVAIQKEGKRVATLMSAKGTTYTGYLNNIEQGTWSLACDIEYQNVVIASVVLVEKLNVDNTKKTINFKWPVAKGKDRDLIGSVDVDAISLRGQEAQITLNGTAASEQISMELVYQPEGSTSNIQVQGSRASLFCDRSGIYVIKIAAETSSSFAIDFAVINCVENIKWLSYSPKEIHYQNNHFYVLTDDNSLISLTSFEEKELAMALGRNINSVAIDSSSQKAALAMSQELVLWDLENDVEIKRYEVKATFPLEKVVYCNEDFAVVNDSGVTSYIIDLKTDVVIAYKGYSMVLIKDIPGTQYKLFLNRGGLASFGYWNQEKELFIEKGSLERSGYYNERYWPLLNGRIFSSTGYVLWLSSKWRSFAPRGPKLIDEQERVTSFAVNDSLVIYVKKNPRNAQLVLANEGDLQTLKSWDLPLILQSDNSFAPVSFGDCALLKDRPCVFAAFPENQWVLLFY